VATWHCFQWLISLIFTAAGFQNESFFALTENCHGLNVFISVLLLPIVFYQSISVLSGASQEYKSLVIHIVFVHLEQKRTQL